MQRLRETTDAPAAWAWALRSDGSPYVAAAAWDGEPPAAPTPEAFEAATRLAGATDLSGDDVPAALRSLARGAAAVPVAGSGDTALAVLFLDAPRPVRPRLLAALDATAARLRGPLSAALAVGRLKAIDDDVRRLDRLAALGSLAAEMAHEIRNPLVSVKTFLQLLPERRDDPEFLKGFLDVANDEMRRMERLLDAVIAQGRPGSEVEGTSRIDEVIGSVAELVRHRAAKRGIALEARAAPECPPVAISGDGLRQIALNLALNAIDATPDGGAVTLHAGADGDTIELRVRDTGPGVPPELRRRIFEPFVSAREDRPGGLGLAITSRITGEAGGRIEVGDAAGGGAEFRVQLPVAR